MCMFVDEWECKVKGEEKPLDVCRVCIKARKTAHKKTKASKKTEESMVKEERSAEEGSEAQSEEKVESGSKDIREKMKESVEEVSSAVDIAEPQEADSEEPTADLKNTVNELESGSIYLMENGEEELTYEFLTEIEESEKRILFVTRKYPPKLKEKYGIELEDSVWLSTSNDIMAIPPGELDTLSLEIEMFLSEGGDFIFIDGVESLFSNNPESTMIQLFQSMEDQLVTNGASMIFGVSPSSIEEEHLSLIKKKLDVNKIPKFDRKKTQEPAQEKRTPEVVNEQPTGPDESLVEEDAGLQEEDRKAKREALRELDEEFHNGDMTVDEYISKRSVLTQQESNEPTMPRSE